MLAKLRALRGDLMVVGVCMEEQLVDRVPTAAHDQRVDVVVTDRGVRDRNPTVEDT